MAEKLWGGRFQRPTAAELERISESFSFDRRLAAAEARGSRLHARMLRQAGVLSEAELAALERGLDQLETELQAEGGASSAGAPEDVHTFVFQRLLALAGAPARKLQTGRSRNEQVALDLRLYLLSLQPELESRLANLLSALAEFAAAQAEVVIPGYTHGQRAQPVSLGHHALAYAEMLLRDRERLRQCWRRLAVSPLGSGALAGAALAYDREAAAKALGLERASRNSLDAVGDRDFVAEAHFVLAQMGIHLSRWAEDWILYSAAEYGWLIMADEYSTGSSLMPQKKNPDALELIRGKSARLGGNLMQALLLQKGLPLAYNRDLQEDKQPLFDSLDTALDCLALAAGVVATVQVDAARAAQAASDPALLATDLADLLVARGVSFHQAHEQVGRLIAAALAATADFRQLPETELRRLLPQLPPEEVRALDAARCLARRNTLGGAAPAQVRLQAERLQQALHG